MAICFNIDEVKLLRAETQEELLTTNIFIYDSDRGTKLLKLSDALKNPNSLILTVNQKDRIEKILDKINKNEDYSDISTIGLPQEFIDSLPDRGFNFKLDEKEEIPGDLLVDTKPEKKTITGKEKLLSSTNPFSKETGNKVSVEQVLDDNVIINPIVKFFNDENFNDATFAIFTPKSLKLNEKFSQLKDYEWDGLKEEGSKKRGWTWVDVLKANKPFLLLVDKNGNPITQKINDVSGQQGTSEYIIRTSMNNIEDYKEGDKFQIVTSDISNGTPALHTINNYTQIKNTDILKDRNLKIKVPTDINNPANPTARGRIFFRQDGYSHNTNQIGGINQDGVFVQIDLKVITEKNYEDIFNNILKILNSNLDDSDKLDQNLKEVARAWTLLVKHGYGTDIKPAHYQDTIKAVYGENKGIGYLDKAGEIQDLGEGVVLTYGEKKSIYFVKQGKKFEAVILKDGVPIKYDSKVIKDLIAFTKDRRFSMPISKGPKGETEVPINTGDYANIFGIKQSNNPEAELKKSITPKDIVEEFGQTKVIFYEKNGKKQPIIANRVFTLEKKGDNSIATESQVKTEVKDVTNTVVLNNKRRAGVNKAASDTTFPRSKSILQRGRTITQEDIDNLKKIFPSLDGRELKLIADTKDTDYWGKVSKKGLYLLDSATVDTLYHEAWHEFSQWYLTKSVKDNLYKQVETITGIKDKREAEEWLAEEFSKFKLGEPINEKLQEVFDKKQNIFQQIITFIKSVFKGLLGSSIKTEFNNLKDAFNGKELSKYSEKNVLFDTLNSVIVKNGEVVFTNTDMMNIVKEFNSVLYSVIEAEELNRRKAENKKGNNYDSPYSYNTILTPDFIASTDFKNNNFSMVRNIIKNNLEATKSEFIKIDGLEDSVKHIDKILNNFDEVISEYIKRTQLPFKDSKGVKFDEEGNIQDIENIEGNRSKSDALFGNEESVMQALPDAVRSIIGSLKVPNEAFNREDFEKGDINGKYLYKESEQLGVPELVNITQTTNKFYQYIQGADNYADILERLEKAAPANPEFFELISKLPTLAQVAMGNPKAMNIAGKFESIKRVNFAYYNSLININSRDGIVSVTGTTLEADKNNINTILANNQTQYSSDLNYNKRSVHMMFEDGSQSVDDFEKMISYLPQTWNGKSQLFQIKNNKGEYVSNNLRSLEFTNDENLQQYLALLEMSGISLNKNTVEQLKGQTLIKFKESIDSMFFSKAVGTGLTFRGFRKLAYIKEGLEHIQLKIKFGFPTELKEKTKILDKEFKNDSAEKLLSLLNREVPFSRFMMRDIFGISGAFKGFDYVMSLDSKFTDLVYTTSIKNANGDPVNTMFLFNGLSKTLSAINDQSVRSIDNLIKKYPHMSYLTMFLEKNGRNILTNHTYLKQIFKENGDRILGNTISWNNMGGHISKSNEQDLDEGTSIGLNSVDKFIQNMIIASAGEKITRPGDSSIESFLVFPTLSYGNIDNEMDNIINHLLNEIYFTYDKGKVNLKEFGFLNDKVNNLLKDKTLKNYEDFKAIENLFKTLNPEIKSIKEDITNVLNKDIEDFNSKIKSYGLKEEYVRSLLNTKNQDDTYEMAVEKYITKKYLNSINQTTLFYGYTGEFKDKFKRNKDMISSGILTSTDVNLLAGINQTVQYSYGHIESLKETNRQAEKEINTILSGDASDDDKIKSIRGVVDKYPMSEELSLRQIDTKNPTYKTQTISKKSYIKYQGWTDRILKDFKISKALNDTGLEENNIKSYEEVNTADAQAWVTFDFYRTFKILIGQWDFATQEPIYQKIASGIKVENALSFFPPIKPHYAGFVPESTKTFSGNIGFQGHAFDKMFFMPMIPGLFKGELEEKHKGMSIMNIGYMLTEDAKKVNKTDEENPYNTRYFAFLKQQINIDPVDHYTAAFATQLRQIIGGFISDLPQGGITQQDNTITNIHQLLENYDNSLKELSNDLREKLLKDLGWDSEKETLNNFKLKTLIDKELSSRDFSSPIIDAVKVNIDGDFVYDLEAVLAKQTLTNLLTSIVNRRLVRILVNGDMLVQGSFKFQSSKTSPDLMFYRLDTINKVLQTIPAGCKIPFRGQWEKLLGFKDKNGEIIGTVIRLNELLYAQSQKLRSYNIVMDKWETEFMKATQMVGVRIPTQGLNSMEVFQIEEFMDPLLGGLIIVPEEITMKAGSDFDVDKLILMYPNLLSDRLPEKINIENHAKDLKKVLEEIKLIKESYKKDFQEHSKVVQKELTIILQDQSNPSDYIKALKEYKISLKSQILAANNQKNSDQEDFDTMVENLKDKNLTKNQREKYIEYRNEYGKSIKQSNDLLKSYLDFSNEIYKSIETIPAFNPTIKRLYDQIDLISKQGINGYLKEIVDPYDKLVQIINKKDDLRAGLKENKLHTFNNVVSSIRDLILHPYRFGELVYPNSTNLIGSVGNLGEKTELKIQENLDVINTSVNKLVILKYLDKYKETHKEINVDHFLKFVYKERSEELQASYDKANSNKIEDIKYERGVLGKSLTGIAAVQVTMINLISNFDIGVQKQMTDIFGTIHRLPLDYFSPEYLRQDSEIIYFNSKTDPSFIREFNSELKLVTNKAKSYQKRNIAEQMVNPQVDALNDKNPISQINVNSETLATVEFMTVYLGINIDLAYTLINQPLVLKHIQNSKINKSKFIKELKKAEGKFEALTGYKLQEAILSEIQEKHNIDSGYIKNSLYGGIPYSETSIINMYNNVGKDMNDIIKEGNPTDIRNQLLHLKNWIAFEQYTQAYRNLQEATNWITSTQNNYFGFQDKIEQLKSVKEEGIFTNIEKLETSVSSNYRVQELTSSILRNLFPITTSKLFTEKALSLSKLSGNKSNFFRLYSNDFFKFVFDNYTDKEKVAKELFGVDYLQTGARQGVLTEFFALKNDERFKGNKFIENVYQNKDRDITNIEVRPPNKEIDTSESISEGIDNFIEVMANSNNDLAEKIILLGLTQDGLNRSPISWTQYIKPEHYAMFMGVAMKKWNAIEDKNLVLDKYSYLFFKNNPVITNNINLNGKVLDYDVQHIFEEAKAQLDANNVTYSGYRFKNYDLNSILNKEIVNLNEVLIENYNQENSTKNEENNIEKIYNNLPNKTESENVIILDKSKGFQKGIFSLRSKNLDQHFGNPFSSDEKLVKKDNLSLTASTKESVKNYISWLTTDEFDDIEPERKEWIVNQLKDGSLKNKPIIYYKELNEPSHANALDYLINKYNWNSEPIKNINQLEINFPEINSDVSSIETNKPIENDCE